MAAVLSGAPSTLWSLIRGDDVVAPTRAAGRLLLPEGGSGLLAAAAAAHAVLSLGWAAVIDAVMPDRLSPVRAALFGAAAGGVIAAVDLGAAHANDSPRLAPIRALPVAPQLADHVAFGACVAVLLRRRDAQISSMASAIESSTRPGR